MALTVKFSILSRVSSQETHVSFVRNSIRPQNDLNSLLGEHRKVQAKHVSPSLHERTEQHHRLTAIGTEPSSVISITSELT